MPFVGDIPLVEYDVKPRLASLCGGELDEPERVVASHHLIRRSSETFDADRRPSVFRVGIKGC